MPLRLIVITLLAQPPLYAVPDFEREVAPILEGNCLSCHDAAGNKGKVRLDTLESLLDFVTPGQPDQSTLIEQISGPDPAMPKKAAPLKPAEVETLRQWIAAGLPWPDKRVLKDDPPRDMDWWSLHPLRDTPQPKSIDSLINAKLSEKALTPMPEAAARTLHRRLSYDLTGLPPDPADPADPADHATWEERINRLLDSPAFGEKFAHHWLDLVRYADTHGYDKDKPRANAWPYRDYIIRSLNQDKPYDRFVQEQLAGDALFPDQPDGILGLGFLAAGPWDLIGHSEVADDKEDGRIAKHLDRDEMVSAVFNVFTSTTVQCAQCHHHKADPVKMEDYYQLHAIFAAVDRADRVYARLPPAREKERDSLIARIEALTAEQRQLIDEAGHELRKRGAHLLPRLDELRQQAAPPTRSGWHSVISQTQDTEKWIQIDLGAPTEIEVLKLIPAYDDFNQIGAGFGFPVRYKLEVSDDAEFTTGVRQILDATPDDQPNPGSRGISIHVGPAAVRYLRITATKLAPRLNDYIFALGEVQAIGGENGENLALGAHVTAHDSIEAAPRWSLVNLTDGIYYSEFSDPAALAELREMEEEMAAIEREADNPQRTARLGMIEVELGELKRQLAAYHNGQLVYAAATEFPGQDHFVATSGQARPIHLLHRGDIRAQGPLMWPGLPPLWPAASEEFDLPPSAPESLARARLAEAITSRDNPLFWRSIVNRLWQWTMGEALVGTPNDFGRMGMAPTHAELLDFLAVTLRDDPHHSLKNIIRLIVSSQAYRRSSSHDEANAMIDAGNQYLWQANRRRLTAEEYRDSLLSAAGVLRTDDRGGPGFQDFIIEKPEHSPHYQYHLYDPMDAASHRRSIYRFVVRSQPQPFLTLLDCADPSQSVPQRDESTTALQALTQWNNPFVQAMAARLAERVQSSADPVTDAFRLTLSRPPTAREQRMLEAYFKAHGPAPLARVLFNLNALVYLD